MTITSCICPVRATRSVQTRLPCTGIRLVQALPCSGMHHCLVQACALFRHVPCSGMCLVKACACALFRHLHCSSMCIVQACALLRHVPYSGMCCYFFYSAHCFCVFAGSGQIFSASSQQRVFIHALAPKVSAHKRLQSAPKVSAHKRPCP